MMKTQNWKINGVLLGLALACLAMRLIHGQALFISPKYPESEGFPAMHIIAAEQLANHSVVVETTQSALPGTNALWQCSASYGCYFQNQFVIASVRNWDAVTYPWMPNYMWVRSCNNPCGASMTSDELNVAPLLSRAMRDYRVTNSVGVVWRIGPELVPACTNGVRRFLGVPVKIS